MMRKLYYCCRCNTVLQVPVGSKTCIYSSTVINTTTAVLKLYSTTDKYQVAVKWRLYPRSGSTLHNFHAHDAYQCSTRQLYVVPAPEVQQQYQSTRREMRKADELALLLSRFHPPFLYSRIKTTPVSNRIIFTVLLLITVCCCLYERGLTCIILALSPRLAGEFPHRHGTQYPYNMHITLVCIRRMCVPPRREMSVTGGTHHGIAPSGSCYSSAIRVHSVGAEKQMIPPSPNPGLSSNHDTVLKCVLEKY